MAIKTSNQITLVDLTDAYSVQLTSDAYTFVGNTVGAPSGLSCTTQVVAYCGTAQCPKVSVTVSCPTGISATVTNNNTSMPTISFKTTATVSSACQATITVVVDGLTIGKKFSFAVAKTGATGATGPTGSAGKGIKTTAVTYQAWANGTTTPTGTWASAPTATSADKPYLWSKTVITYTDNTTSTTYSVGSTPEGIVVGGRNILLKSNVSATNTNYRITTYESSLPLKANTDYTVVVRAKLVEGRNLNFYVGQTRGAPIKLASDGTEKTYYKQFTSDAIEIITPNTVYFYNNIPDTSTGGGVEATVYWACLYEGHVKPPMQWIAAPEDIDDKIDSIEVGGRNFIKNSSFESSREWTCGTGISWDSNVVSEGYDGGKCFKVEGTFGVTKHAIQMLSSNVGKIVSAKGETFTLSYMAKTENVVFGTTNPWISVYVSYYKEDGRWSHEMFSEYKLPVGTSDWHKVTLTRTVRSDKPLTKAHDVTLLFRDYTGTVWIDQIKLEKGDKATDWTPAPEDMASFDEVQNAQKAADDAQKTADDASNLADSTENRVGIAEANIKILNEAIKSIVTDANGSTLMTQTSTGWTFDISGIEKSISDAVGTLNNLSGTVNEAENAITNLDKIVDDVIKKTAYIIMTTDDSGAPCIELGKEGNPFKVRITNTAVDFMQGTYKIAYISNSALYIEKAVVKNELQIGDGHGFVWKKRASGNLGLRWV